MKQFRIQEVAQTATGLPPNVGLVFQSNEWGMQMALVDLDVISSTKVIAAMSALKPKDIADSTARREAHIARQNAQRAIEKAVIGGITASKEDVWRVNSAAATKGYGPLLYRLAMQFATSRGSALSANPVVTSSAATSVWKRFENEPDVEVVNTEGQGVRRKAYKLEGDDYLSLAKRYDDLNLGFDNDLKYVVYNEVRGRAG